MNTDKRIRKTSLPTLVLLGLTIPTPAQMQPAEEPAEIGLVSQGKDYFPQGAGTSAIKIPNGSFTKTKGGKPQGWQPRNSKILPQGGPGGRPCLDCAGGRGTMLATGGIEVVPMAPHFLSCWLKTGAPIETIFTLGEARTYYGRHISLLLPATGNEWKRVGIYLRNLAGGQNGGLRLRSSRKSPCPPFQIADIRMRTATEEEFQRAWWGWRAKYPKRNLSARPGDGKNLALTTHKLKHGFSPSRPFTILALGSSYTNMLGDGETLRQHIRRRFPQSPPIVYIKHVGSSVPWRYVRGWVEHIAIPAQPDLVLIYTIGQPGHLDRLLQDLRHSTTADIIVPSIHWRLRDRPNWGKSEDAKDQVVEEIRAICAKYGNVEFVESRKEWAAYLVAHRLEIKVDPEKGLLKDNVHQSDYGALVINENIARHLVTNKKTAYLREAHERQLPALIPTRTAHRSGEWIKATNKWRPQANCLTTKTKDERLTVEFRGNRIAMVGLAGPGGGTARVFIDGIPAAQAPVFYMGYIRCGDTNRKPARGQRADQSPHGVKLGRNIIPQKWNIRMVNDQGDYTLIGSVTGPDGLGNNRQPFTGKSGQIIIPPGLWRGARDRRSGRFTNARGDSFSFRVYRCARGEISWRGPTKKRFYTNLVENLPNGPHTLELVPNGDGPVSVESFHIYEPPQK